jgi:uncharacterized RDD family membrane protein YckC
VAIDSFVDIITPENICFRYQVAGPFRRLPAFAMDLLIRGMIFGILLALFLAMGALSADYGVPAVAILILSWFLLEWFYGAVLENWWSGQTPGKKLMGLRALTIDGRPINTMQAVMRNVLRSADFMPLVPIVVEDGEAQLWAPTMFIGFACMALSPCYQRLGDLVCGTMVVVEEHRRFPLRTIPDDPQLRLLMGKIPAHFRPTQRLSRAIAVYVERRRLFSAARRTDIARYLANPLIATWDLPKDTSPDLLLCALHAHLFAKEQIAA